MTLAALTSPATSQQNESSFGVMQAQMGVRVFGDICLDTLPDFTSAEARMRELGAEPAGGAWSLGNGALVISVQSDDRSRGCLATIMDTTPIAVVTEIAEALEQRYGGFELREIEGSPRAFFQTRSGLAAVTAIAASNAMTVFVQPAPN